MLFSDIVFGPIKSRRLGVSLGINLLPTENKWCNFNCIYCECGWNDKQNGNDAPNKASIILPTRKEVYGALEQRLAAINSGYPDVITFSGNGEPTMHPEFSGIIDDTILLRDKYSPESKVSVLSNATMLDRPDVVSALKKIDNNILKLDSAFPSTIELIDQPLKTVEPDKLAGQLKIFDGKFIIQTMFLRGKRNGVIIDNTIQAELDAWESWILKVRPASVMIYSLDRDTPADNLEKIMARELESIADRVRRHGIIVSVAS